MKHYTRQNLSDVRGPITVVAGKKRRITLVEAPGDLCGMMVGGGVVEAPGDLCGTMVGGSRGAAESWNGEAGSVCREPCMRQLGGWRWKGVSGGPAQHDGDGWAIEGLKWPIGCYGPVRHDGGRVGGVVAMVGLRVMGGGLEPTAPASSKRALPHQHHHPISPHPQDAAKYADLVLLLIDGAFGFEMETFEFLNLLQVGGGGWAGEDWFRC